MATVTATALPAMASGQIAGARIWADGADTITAYLSVASAPTVSTIVARDASGGIAGVAGTFTTTLTVTGGANGTAAFSGDLYSHCLVTAGFDAGTGGGNRNTLSDPHQVGFYGAVTGNSNANSVNGFVCGFESALGIAAGAYTLGRAVSFSVGAVGAGAGATVTRTIGYMPNDDTIGTAGNAAVCDFAASLTFTGNWFIYYSGSRASYFGGAMTVTGILTHSTDIQMSDGNAGHGILSTNSTRVLSITNAGVGIPNVTGAVAFAGMPTFGAAGTAITLTAGDVQYSSNAGYGILSANSTRVLAVTNAGIGIAGTLTGATTISTADPGSGIGAWKLGKKITAASVMSATTYLEVMVDGALLKVCIN